MVPIPIHRPPKKVCVMDQLPRISKVPLIQTSMCSWPSVALTGALRCCHKLSRTPRASALQPGKSWVSHTGRGFVPWRRDGCWSSFSNSSPGLQSRPPNAGWPLPKTAGCVLRLVFHLSDFVLITMVQMTFCFRHSHNQLLMKATSGRWLKRTA